MEAIDAVIKLNKIFKAKKWTENDIDEFIFDSFCKLFTNLNDKQRELIIELIENYTWIPYKDYLERILKTFNKVEPAKLTGLDKIYLFPIIKLKDEGKDKSGVPLINTIKRIKKLLKNYEHIEFISASKFEHLAQGKFILHDRESLFLVDDYIGSGETINECLEIVQENQSITTDKINIISIVTQQFPYTNLQKRGYSIYSDFIPGKGITDHYTSPILDEKIELMIEIEKMIPDGKQYSFGYKATEALVTLLRTPDNTFPIFWKRHKRGTNFFEAPFSREEIYEL